MSITDYAAASPVEIDTELAALYHEERQHRAIISRNNEATRRSANSKNSWDKIPPYRLERMEAETEAARAEVARIEELEAPGEEQYDMRHWSRYFLVNNPGGHVHKSQHCSSCYPTTQYLWLVELSGLSGPELIEQAGERVCTVCFPDAPVASLSNPSMLKPDVEARAAKAERDAEREAKRAEKAKKALTNPDGSEIRLEYGSARTVVSGQRELASAMWNLGWYNQDGNPHPSNERWARDIEVLITALSVKLDRDPEEIRAEYQAKTDKKLAKDLRRWR